MSSNVVGCVQLSEILGFPYRKFQSELSELDRISLMQCITQVGKRVFPFLINLRAVFESLRKYNLIT